MNLFIYLTEKVFPHKFFSAKRPRKLIPANVFEATRRLKNLVPRALSTICNMSLLGICPPGLLSIGAFIHWGFCPCPTRGCCSPGDTMTGVTYVAVQIQFLFSHNFHFISSSHNYSLNYSYLLTASIFHYGMLYSCSGWFWHLLYQSVKIVL